MMEWSGVAVVLFLLWGTSGAVPLQNDGGDLLRSMKGMCDPVNTSDSTWRKVSEHFSLPETKHTSEFCLARGPGCYEKRPDGYVWLPLIQRLATPSDYLILGDDLYFCPGAWTQIFRKRFHVRMTHDPPPKEEKKPWQWYLFLVVSIAIVGGAVLLVYVAITSPINLISSRVLKPYTSPCLQHRSIF